MPLDIIGAGFGRTGTMSMKLALEQLGFGPCYHMVEVFQNEDAAEHWAAAAKGEKVDWHKVFAGYGATVDWPGCDYWRELMAVFPAAKIILTVRDADAWFESTQNTIFSAQTLTMLEAETPMAETIQAIFRRNFENRQNDRDVCIAAYKRHNENVMKTVDAKQLLVFNAAEGWAPLCRFLGVEVPATPFPKANTTDEFRARAQQA